MAPTPREQELEIEVRLLKEQIRELIGRIQTPLHAVELKKAAPPKPDKNANVDWTKVEKRCPVCKKVKKVMPDFGTHFVRTTTYPQSHCNSCRSKNSYYVPVAERGPDGKRRPDARKKASGT